MNDLPRQKLCEIIAYRDATTAKTGRDVLNDSRLCKAIVLSHLHTSCGVGLPLKLICVLPYQSVKMSKMDEIPLLVQDILEKIVAGYDPQRVILSGPPPQFSREEIKADLGLAWQLVKSIRQKAGIETKATYNTKYATRNTEE